MRELSPLAWVVIILFALFIIVLNVNLVFALLKKPGGRAPMKKKNKTGLVSMDLVKNPWKQEDQQWAELSRRVADIQTEDPPNPPQ